MPRRPLTGGNLLLGILLLVVIVASPAFAVLIAFQQDLYGEREAQAKSVALRQVELINATIADLAEATHEVMTMVTELDAVERLDPGCGRSLDQVRRRLPDYLAFAVIRPDGALVCGSTATSAPAAVLQPFAAPFGRSTGFTVGGYSNLPALGRPMLTFSLPFGGADGMPPGVLVAGLDLRRLDTLLAAAQQHVSGTLVIRDRDATVLARVPDSAATVGERPDGPDRAMMDRSMAGATVFQDSSGRHRVLGYVPVALPPVGLFVSAGFDVAELNSGIDQAARRGYALILAGVVCSFAFALLFGHRYLRVPAAALLTAARQLGSGDLTARVHMPRGGASEFGGLARAFNDMAGMLQRQRSELQGLNEALELRVAERTRALLASNNRLQVEIAEREMTESNLRQAQKLQAVGQLAGGIAHDFNNLLTVILGSLELLRKCQLAPETRVNRLIDHATVSVERGSRLTAQLLAFSRKQPLLAVSVDVAEAISGLRELLASTLGAAVRLQVKTEDGLWPVMLDPNQFEAAIVNLTLNACAAMPDGGRMSVVASNVSLTEAAAMPDVPSGDYVRIAVADSGCGMSADTLSRAFEPFFTTKEPGSGSGLGLSQVHGMVRQTGGSVTIDSRPGDGTTVTMLLPRSLAVTTPTDEANTSLTVPALTRDRLLLLVDDDTQVREITAATLTENGYTVVAAADGLAALAVLEQQGERVALVIADYAMPGMTGRELLETVRQRRPDVAVLLATGYADYPDLTSETLAIDQIVRKPFRASELLARIHMVCNRQARAEAMQEVS